MLVIIDYWCFYKTVWPEDIQMLACHQKPRPMWRLLYVFGYHAHRVPILFEERQRPSRFQVRNNNNNSDEKVLCYWSLEYLRVRSEQQLTDCTYTGYDGCQGGNFYDVWSYLMISPNGLETTANYPWKAATKVSCLLEAKTPAFIGRIWLNRVVEWWKTNCLYSVGRVRFQHRKGPASQGHELHRGG